MPLVSKDPQEEQCLGSILVRGYEEGRVKEIPTFQLFYYVQIISIFVLGCQKKEEAFLGTKKKKLGEHDMRTGDRRTGEQASAWFFCSM